MPEYPHDPEFPFLVIAAQTRLIARFAELFHAENYLEVNKTPRWEIVDTTPKPRIPVDASYVAIEEGGRSFIAVRGELGWKVIGDGQPFWFSDEDFEASSKNAEITVLDPRKEES